MDIFILPQCHQQPAATNLCGFYVIQHMNVLLGKVSNSKGDIPEDVVYMQNTTSFSSIEILMCTGSEHDSIYVAFANRDNGTAPGQAINATLRPCRVSR